MGSLNETQEEYGEGGYPKTKLNTVIRYRNRGQYDFSKIYPIVDEAPILHVAFQSSPDVDDFAFPVILPMMGCTGIYPDSPDPVPEGGARPIYLHGYVSARLMRLSRSASEGGGIPVCVSATLMDGVVLALTPNHHSCNYRSAVAYGHARVVEDEGERLWAMERITNNLVADRWAHTRYPKKTELRSTGILRVDLHSASAKVRRGTTGEAREDLKDEGMRKEVWAGVVPMHTTWGEPIPAPTNMMPEVPAYIRDWREQWNEKAERYPMEAGRE